MQDCEDSRGLLLVLRNHLLDDATKLDPPVHCTEGSTGDEPARAAQNTPATTSHAATSRAATGRAATSRAASYCQPARRRSARATTRAASSAVSEGGAGAAHLICRRLYGGLQFGVTALEGRQRSEHTACARRRGGGRRRLHR